MAKIVNSVKFVFPASRPGAGTELASYTAAWLDLSGLDSGGLIPAAEVEQIMGKNAFGYHCRNGNLERTADGVKLTDQGFLHFGNLHMGVGRNRNIRPDPEMVKAYALTLATGKPSALVKNAKLIKPL
jgi:hypothetical protein